MEGVGHPGPESLDGKLSVPDLGALVVGDDPDLGAQALEQPGPLAGPEVAGDPATSKRSSTRVLTLLACCPPGPPLGVKRTCSSESGTEREGVTLPHQIHREQGSRPGDRPVVCGRLVHYRVGQFAHPFDHHGHGVTGRQPPGRSSPAATPAGVPVEMTMPTSRVNAADRCSII